MQNPIRWLAREAGLRFLARRKAACTVAVLTVALALGANTLVFSVTKAFLLASFALPDADRVFVVAPVRELEGRGEVVFSEAYPNYALLRETNRSFEDVAVLQQSVVSWDDNGEARPLQSARVSASFFTTMAAPAQGRAFDAGEEGRQAAQVAIISHGLWQGAFAGTEDVLGRTMRINGAAHTVVGVMPPGFTHPLPTEIWLPFTLASANAWTSITGARSLSVYGRLKDGVSEDAARREMDAFTQRTIEASADNRDFRYTLQSFRQVLLPGADRVLLFVQIGALLLVLLAVSNLASLLIAWGFDRSKEIAVRLSLGSSTGAIARLLLLQSVVVVGAGGVLGLILARIAQPVVRGLDVTPALGLFFANLEIDGGVLLWSGAAILLAGMLAGILPAWFATRGNLADTLRAASRGASLSPAAVRSQKSMIALQSVLSVVILAAAALAGASFYKLSQVSPGYTAEGRTVARVQLGDPYAAHPDRVRFADRLLANLAAEGELTAYGFTSTLPVGDQRWGGRFHLDPADAGSNVEPELFHFRRVSHGYLETMGIPVLRGRTLTAQDDSTRPAVAVVSNALAKRLFPDGDAVGRRIYRVLSTGGPQPVEIVGVVGDVTDADSNAPVGETVYVPWPQISLGQMSIVATGRSDANATLAAIRRALAATDPLIAANNTAQLDALLRQSTALPRLQTILLLSFALVALSMVVLGSYGVMSQVVATREREFALRLLFGAMPVRLAGRVLLQVATLAGTGTLIGVGAVWMLSGALQPLLFGVDARSPIALAVVPLTVILVAIVASLPPAWRAMRTEVQKAVMEG